ncbi:uncharacterized protein LOC133823328 [Humulus lupulus]|uniref:uncharacterized protein LOC133823328 n=1 Tax=Humulus lupulus TaxID=3486 RepID=UPI002B404D36|nr:uncharacterized protein LOC133823328 [Humulus lupulus]
MVNILKGQRGGVKGEHLKHASINGVDIYTITSQQRSIPSWIGDKNQKVPRRVKQKDHDMVSLLQDLWFETATTKIKATPDGDYLMASGIYPPQVKVYELSQLSMKFERHLDSEIIDFQILSDDYSKIAFLCTDRTVYFHAKYGKHCTMRIPRMGRDIAYDYWSCDLFCAASSPDLYRINLEQGRFLSPLTTQSPALNVVSRSKVHGLVACGGEDGSVECFDMRMRSSVGRINAVSPASGAYEEVTALEFDGDADFEMAVGSSGGKVLIYDLRSSQPVQVKDHMYDSPILSIQWHQVLGSEQPKLITTDSHIVKIWDSKTGDGMTSIEPAAGKINDICVFKDTGLILLALDSSQIPAYFLPVLGPAPKWSPRLQQWEELELEGNKESFIYDKTKFLTKEDLDKLNLTNLIGTDLVRASLHGYFVDYSVYSKAKALADPSSYDKYIEQRKQEKLDKELANRITTKRKLPKVNRNLAKQIAENEEAENEKKDDDDKDIQKPSRKKKAIGSDIFKDDRFTKMFESKDFEIDEFSQEYRALHPVASTKKQPSLVEEHFESVSEGEEASEISNSSEDELNNDQSKMRKKGPVPRLLEVKDERHAEAFFNRTSLANEDSLPLGERLVSLNNNPRTSSIPDGVRLGPGGSREISFSARSSTKYVENTEGSGRRGEDRRGVGSLGLKSTFGGRGRGGHRGRGRGRRGGRGRGRR